MIFTRCPEPGRTKTRLIPALGAQAAADLARRLTEHTLSEAADLAQERSADVEVWFDGGDARAIAACYGTDLSYRRQEGADLGARMQHAFECALAVDPDRHAVLVGTDCPSLSADLLRSAFEALSRSDLVLGPARDGGYYLIGLRRRAPELFQGIAWGSSSVCAQTLSIAERLGLSIAKVATLDDVDRPEDLARLPERFARDLVH